MLQPAHVGHLSILRSLIRDGAARGSFDRELATDSREAALFFSNLRQALDTGYFVEEDPRTGDLTTVAVPATSICPTAVARRTSRSDSACSRRSTSASSCGSPASTPNGAATATAARCWPRCSRRRPASAPISCAYTASAATARRWRICSRRSATCWSRKRSITRCTCAPTRRRELGASSPRLDRNDGDDRAARSRFAARPPIAARARCDTVASMADARCPRAVLAGSDAAAAPPPDGWLRSRGSRPRLVDRVLAALRRRARSLDRHHDRLHRDPDGAAR